MLTNIKILQTCTFNFNFQFIIFQEEATWEGYLKIKKNRDAPVPLTMAEEELAEIKRTEVHSEIGIDTKHQTLQGVLFPLTKNAYAALEKFRNKQLNYLQLKIGNKL